MVRKGSARCRRGSVINFQLFLKLWKSSVVALATFLTRFFGSRPPTATHPSQPHTHLLGIDLLMGFWCVNFLKCCVLMPPCGLAVVEKVLYFLPGISISLAQHLSNTSTHQDLNTSTHQDTTHQHLSNTSTYQHIKTSTQHIIINININTS